MWNPFSREQGDASLSSSLSQTISKIDGKILNGKPTGDVKQFIDEKPGAVYIIDGKKGETTSIICRTNDQGEQECLKLNYENVELFKKMQKFEYFCSLPNDVDATYFECRKIL